MAQGTGLEKIVHILPLGHEIDRAVIPFLDSMPNRIYILAVINNPDLNQDMIERQRYFVKQVKAKLNKSIGLSRLIPTCSNFRMSSRLFPILSGKKSSRETGYQ